MICQNKKISQLYLGKCQNLSERNRPCRQRTVWEKINLISQNNRQLKTGLTQVRQVRWQITFLCCVFYSWFFFFTFKPLRTTVWFLLLDNLCTNNSRWEYRPFNLLIESVDLKYWTGPKNPICLRCFFGWLGKKNWYSLI